MNPKKILIISAVLSLLLAIIPFIYLNFLIFGGGGCPFGGIFYYILTFCFSKIILVSIPFIGSLIAFRYRKIGGIVIIVGLVPISFIFVVIASLLLIFSGMANSEIASLIILLFMFFLFVIIVLLYIIAIYYIKSSKNLEDGPKQKKIDIIGIIINGIGIFAIVSMIIAPLIYNRFYNYFFSSTFEVIISLFILFILIINLIILLTSENFIKNYKKLLLISNSIGLIISLIYLYSYYQILNPILILSMPVMIFLINLLFFFINKIRN